MEPSPPLPRAGPRKPGEGTVCGTLMTEARTVPHAELTRSIAGLHPCSARAAPQLPSDALASSRVAKLTAPFGRLRSAWRVQGGRGGGGQRGPLTPAANDPGVPWGG